MSSLILPQSVYEAEVREQMLLDLGAMRYWNEKLQKLDEFLQLVRIAENATTEGLKPGFWHVFRMKPGVPATNVLTLEHDDGSFREPDSWMLHKLEGQDWQNPRVMAERKAKEAGVERAKEHRRAEERGEMVEEIAGTLKGRNSPGVNYGTKKWSRDPKARHR